MLKEQLNTTIDNLLEEHKRKRCFHMWVTRVKLHKMSYKLVDYKRCNRCGEVKYT